jgi:hypothetical protein
MSDTKKNYLRVTVSRINEGPHDPSSEEHEAHTVTVENGTLRIQGADGGRHLGPASWDQFTVKRVGVS